MASRFVLPFSDVGQGILPSDGAKLFFFATGTSTPKDTFSDAAGTVPNANPVIADASGVFGDIFISGSYKAQLKDKNDVLIWEADPVDEFALSSNVRSLLNDDKRYGPLFATVSAMTTGSPVSIDGVAVDLQSGMTVQTQGYTSATDDGGARYLIRTAAEFGATPDEKGDHTLANGNVAVLQNGAMLNVRQFGAVADGVTNDSAALQACIDAAETLGRTIYAQAGVYIIGTKITLPYNVNIIGDAVPTSDPTNTVLGTRFKRSTALTMIEINGSNRTTDRIGHNVLERLAFEDAANTGSAAWISSIYADSIVFRDCMFFQDISVTVTGHCIDAEECWDWRFYNCIWKQVGSATADVIRAFNGADDSCNAWNFIDCRWQESRGFAVNFDCTGAGNDNVEFFFTSCKWEDTGANAPRHITVTEGASGQGASRIHFVGCFIWTADGYLCATGSNGGEWIWTNCQFANGGKGESPQAYLQINVPNCSVSNNMFQVPGAAHVGIASYIDADFTNTQNINIMGNTESGGGAGTRGFDTHKLIDTQPRFSTISGNSDFRMKTTGANVLNSGTTSVVVTHNIAVGTPLSPQVRVTPLGNLGSAKTWWVSAVGATTFTINVDADPGINVTFAWEVDAETRTE